jgi:hypothetical protein
MFETITNILVIMLLATTNALFLLILNKLDHLNDNIKAAASFIPDDK